MSNQNGSNGSAPAELARVLTLRSLVFYGIAFIIPLAFFTTYGIVTNTTHGHVSMTYVVATLCMVFTALGMGCTFYSDCNWCKPVGNQSCRYFQQCCCYHSIDFLSSIIDYDRSLYHRS